MNFQGLHRTIQFSISSLALGKRQKHNISHFFDFANRFLIFFRFFSKPNFFKNLRSAKFCVLYQPRCVVVSTRNRNIIYHTFLTLQIVFENFFDFFSKPETVSKMGDSQKCCVYISLAASSFSTRNRNIIYHRFGTLQIVF